jgi:hypothetical protein
MRASCTYARDCRQWSVLRLADMPAGTGSLPNRDRRRGPRVMSLGLRLVSQYVVEDDAIGQCSQARRAPCLLRKSHRYTEPMNRLPGLQDSKNRRRPSSLRPKH